MSKSKALRKEIHQFKIDNNNWTQEIKPSSVSETWLNPKKTRHLPTLNDKKVEEERAWKKQAEDSKQLLAKIRKKHLKEEEEWRQEASQSALSKKSQPAKS